MKCKICGQDSIPFDRALVLGRYDVQYFRCRDCGFIQTETPYWLGESYADAINSTDIGLVSRNIRLSQCAGVLIDAFFASGQRFLDFGGGYGMLVRIMRDRGYDFFRLDTHCENLFAKSFDVQDTEAGNWDLVTAFEVFEHLSDPSDQIADMLSYSRNILFTTSLLPAGVEKIKDWWYFGAEHGQHIALYTHSALSAIARQHGLNLYSDRSSLHLITEKKIKQSMFWALSRYRVASVISASLRAVRGRKTLADGDRAKVTAGIR